MIRSCMFKMSCQVNMFIIKIILTKCCSHIREPQVTVQKEASEDQVTLEDPEVTAKNTEKKFKEREIPKLSKTDEVVPFKKRKLNSERKRNIRQTKFDS